MPTLKSLAPELVSQLAAALVQSGHRAIAEQLERVAVLRCTFGSDNDVGYVYLVREKVSALYANLSAPVAETISFYMEHGLNLDLDHEGQLFGVEYVGRPDIANTLKAANVL
jgi:hypothetical protein